MNSTGNIIFDVKSLFSPIGFEVNLKILAFLVFVIYLWVFELDLSNLFRYFMFRGVLNDLQTLGFIMVRNQGMT
jgi:hypothetical protein